MFENINQSVSDDESQREKDRQKCIENAEKRKIAFEELLFAADSAPTSEILEVAKKLREQFQEDNPRLWN